MNNEILKDIIKECVTDEMIKEAIYDVVNELFDYHIKRAIENRAIQIANEFVDKKLEDIIAPFFKAEVKVEDPWNGVTKYKSFEEYIRQYIKSKVASTYELETTMRRLLDDRLQTICKQVIKNNLESMQQQVVEEFAKESA